MSALSLHHDHDVVKQLALTRVDFKSLSTHPELCTGSLDPGSRLSWSSSFFLETRGAEHADYLDPNSQTNYPLTSLATRHSGLVLKDLWDIYHFM